MMLVLHDDAQREYDYGPANGLPDSKVGTFTQALYDEAKKDASDHRGGPRKRNRKLKGPYRLPA